jgi:glutaredoxin
METLKVYGADWCRDCRRTKRFLVEQRVPFEWIDIERNPGEIVEVERRGGGMRVIPTVVFPDGSHLLEPTNEVLAQRLGLAPVA